MFRICCHSATNLLQYQYLGTFLVAARWQQNPVFGEKTTKIQGKYIENWCIFMGF